MGLLVPDRRRGHEILDDRTVDPATRIGSIRDVVRSNGVFGGRRAAAAAVASIVDRGTQPLTLLDVGTGLGDIPLTIVRRVMNGPRIRTIGLDEAVDLLVAGRQPGAHAVCGSARSLPFRDRSIDVVLCSQLLHHFPDDDLSAVIIELDRVARGHVVIADLRRSWIAVTGFWLASWILRFHAVTRHDGVVSVLRGFTPSELRRAIVTAIGVEPRIERWLGFRLTATWRPRGVA